MDVNDNLSGDLQDEGVEILNTGSELAPEPGETYTDNFSKESESITSEDEDSSENLQVVDISSASTEETPESIQACADLETELSS